MPLYYPFRPYRKHPKLFDGGSYFGELAVRTMVQIVIEIITDNVCLVFEARSSRRSQCGASCPKRRSRRSSCSRSCSPHWRESTEVSSETQWTSATPRRVLVRGRRPPVWRRARGLLLAAVPEQLGTTDELSKTTQARTLWLCSQAERKPTKAVVALAAQHGGKSVLCYF
jgi:hypothetical protein